MYKESFSIDLLRKLGKTKQNVETLQSYAIRLCNEMGAYLNSEDLGSQFTFNEDAVSGDLFTPFGEGRIRFEPKIGVSGIISSRLIVEKKIEDSSASHIWQPVWSIRIDDKGNCCPGETGASLVDISDEFAIENDKSSIQTLARSVFCSIGFDSLNP